MPDAHGTIKVKITSIDGNITHAFRLDQTVDDVRQFGYDRLVQDKNQIPLNNTWIEHLGTRIDNDIKLSSLVSSKKDPDEKGHERGDEPDLILNLAWTQQGGSDF